MIGYLCAYVVIALAIRELSGRFSIFEIGALRSVGSVVIAAGLAWHQGLGRAEFARASLRGDVARSVLHMLGALGLIWSMANLPLSLVSVVEFSGPLFAAAIVFLATGMLPGRVACLGLALLTSGLALLLVRVGFDGNPGLFVALGAAAALTASNIMLARLAARRSTLTIILLMHGIQLPIYLALAAVVPDGTFGGHKHDFDTMSPASLALMIGAALALAVGGFVTQAALANASRHASALQLCAADALRVPLVALAAFLVLSEKPLSGTVLPGLLVLAGVIVTSLPQRPRRGSS
ncbi:MAG: hypothetical protein DI527_16720 [Chelatococcus sp.]|nr:MAG: hypothetical protein DI527_16720 [Chelatococcus sp.]